MLPCHLQNLGSHLDHVGALAYFTEVCGYSGPIYMTVSPFSATCLMKCLPEHMQRFVEVFNIIEF